VPVTEPATACAVKPRPVFCVIERHYRSRAVADDAVAGRFTSGGITLDLGPVPDWLADGLPHDEEWRIEWGKFYFGLDLADAYANTGDAIYLRTWEALVTTWIAQVAPQHDPTDVIGRRVQNWVYAWQTFACQDPPGPGASTVEQLLASITDQVAHLRSHLTPERNHRTLELYALLIAALALPPVDPRGELRDFAWAALHANLQQDVWPDGVHRECSTHYHHMALRSYLGARENARRFHLAVPAAYDDRLRLACRAALHLHRPDRSVPAISDADQEDHTDLLLLADRLLGMPELRWAATAGADGTPPVERNVSFPCGGYVIQRSGWGDRGDAYTDERWLVLDAGPLGDGGHGHYDALHLEAYAYGRPLVVDPGRYTYSESGPNWRRWFKGTAAHNTVTVDGLDQTPYRRGKPKHDRVARARVLWRHGTDDHNLDVVRGRVDSPCYDALHTRDVLFVAGEYWLVADHLTAATAHDYAHRLHLTARAEGRTTVVSRDHDVVVRAPDVDLVYPPGTIPRIEPGWVAPAYGIKERAPVISVERRAATDASFLVVMWPRRGSVRPPRLVVVHHSPDLVSVRLEGVGRDGRCADHVAWAVEPSRLRLGALSVTGRVAWMRVDERRGRPGRLAVYEGEELSWGGPDPVPDLVPAGDGWSTAPSRSGED
jgi:Heparinase II/III-like protein/Heparinase II/III N-terminus